MRRARKMQRRQRRQAQRPHRRRRPAYRQTWLECQSQLLTSWFWRVAHRAAGPYQAIRWQLMPLLVVAMMMVCGRGRAVQDRFEEARELYVGLYPHARRPGKSLQGFLDALARLPRYLFRAILPLVRARVARLLDRGWYVDGWIPFGVDGSRLALPRYAALERHFGTAGTGDFPHLWITSLVHLPTGVPWAWRFGRSDASERHQFCALVPTLPERALVVADAGFVGYEVWETLLNQGRHFLIRLCGNVQVYADYEVRPDFAEGRVYLWPISQPHKKPLPLRMVWLPGQGEGKQGVWLATSVLSATELSRRQISHLFRLRWQHEVFYRTYKCTLQRVKLSSRTTKQVIREAEIALLGVQVFLAQAAWAVSRTDASRTASCAEALRQVHREWRFLLKHGRLQTGYLARLGQAQREYRPNRTSPKNYRTWPRKRQHKPPGPPQIAPFPAELKARLAQEVMAA